MRLGWSRCAPYSVPLPGRLPCCTALAHCCSCPAARCLRTAALALLLGACTLLLLPCCSACAMLLLPRLHSDLWVPFACS